MPRAIVAAGATARPGGHESVIVTRTAAGERGDDSTQPQGGSTMDLRPLGRTGVQVSELCLGAMMFGAWGNPDHDDSIRIIHRALDGGINFIDTSVGSHLRVAAA